MHIALRVVPMTRLTVQAFLLEQLALATCDTNASRAIINFTNESNTRYVFHYLYLVMAPIILLLLQVLLTDFLRDLDYIVSISASFTFPSLFPVALNPLYRIRPCCLMNSRIPWCECACTCCEHNNRHTHAWHYATLGAHVKQFS
jgi:hypothetical protein